MAVTIERVGTTRDRLGESPVWDARERRLWWLDSLAGRLHRLDPQSGALDGYDVPPPAGSFGLHADGGVVLTLRHGFHRLDPRNGAVVPLADIGLDHPDVRLNDGKVDRQGRFLAGTMHMNLAPGATPLGGLYRLEPDGRVRRLAEDIVTANGPCLSPDGRTLYLADSARQVILAFDYAGEVPTGRRRCIDLAPLGTAPDGATVDAEGRLWVALVRSGEIGCFAPDGRPLRRIAMPVRHPTSLAFGGPGLDVLFVTSISASQRLTDPAPEAGGLFAVTGLGARGIAEKRIGV